MNFFAAKKVVRRNMIPNGQALELDVLSLQGMLQGGKKYRQYLHFGGII